MLKIIGFIENLGKKELRSINYFLFYLLVVMSSLLLISAVLTLSVSSMIFNGIILIWMFLMNPVASKKAGLTKDKEFILNFGITVSALLVLSFGIDAIKSLFSLNILTFIFLSLVAMIIGLYTFVLMQKKA